MAEGIDEGFVSLEELLDQIQTNKKHFKRLGSSSGSIRSSKSSSELQARVDCLRDEFCARTIHHTTSLPQLGTPTGTGPGTRVNVPVKLPSVREHDVDPDTFMLLCLPCPVMTLQAVHRQITTQFRNFWWPRPPLPCVETTCGPVLHVRSCEYHPLSSAGLPYNKPIRRSLSPANSKVLVRRTVSL